MSTAAAFVVGFLFAAGAAGGLPAGFAGCQVQSEANIEHRLQCGDEIAELREFYRQQPGDQLVHVSELQAILAELPVEPVAVPSWGERFWAWFWGLFADRDDELPDWLNEISISEQVFETILYLSMAGIVLVAAYVVYTEVRHGLKHRRTVDASVADMVPEGGPAPEVLSLDQVKTAALQQQPGLLLQLILARLEQRELLQPQRVFTHRDIVAHTRGRSYAPQLETVVRAAEHATYGGWVPDAAQMQDVMDAGASLLRGAELQPGE